MLPLHPRCQSAPDDGNYIITVYVNGALDVSLTFHDTVLPSNGPLSLGKDPWFDSTRMLVSDLKLYNEPLTDGAVATEFRKGSPAHQVYALAARDSHNGQSADVWSFASCFRD